ncbi:MAG TPA: nuclear transport factor 2 family protein [Nannocystaceae bacterium]|nr:nuclear transport factor 2 family protein [Nannocystaceae bacterium]
MPWSAAVLSFVALACAADDSGDDAAAGTEDTGSASTEAGMDDDAASTMPSTLTADSGGDEAVTTVDSDGSDGEGDGTTGAGLEPPTSVEEAIAIYGSAWNEPDPAARSALLELVWADGGIYRDPTVVAEGAAALSDTIGGFQQAFPDAELQIPSAVDEYGGLARFSWMITGSQPLPGMDFVEIGDDFRITGITGFFGELPAESEIPPALQAYLDAWNEPDAAMRQALLAEAVTEDVHYTDPTVDAEGLDALDSAIAGFQESFAGSTLVAASGLDAYGAERRYAWAIEDADGNVTFSGIDVARVADDGRLVRVVGFFD